MTIIARVIANRANHRIKLGQHTELITLWPAARGYSKCTKFNFYFTTNCDINWDVVPEDIEIVSVNGKDLPKPFKFDASKPKLSDYTL